MQERMKSEAPLAARMRPRTLDEYIGQEHIVGEGKLLRRAIEADRLGSVILYGPSGVGKSALVRLIARLERRPALLISGSAVGWYGAWQDECLTEFDGGKRCFCHRVCDAWERAAKKAERYGVRVVRLRIGTVLGTEGGLLAGLLTPFNFGIGGPIGNGRQWVSWIARDDLVRLIAHIIMTPQLAGPVNATAPEPVRNAAFAAELGRELRRPALLRLPGGLLRRLAGDMAEELLLSGQRVLPDKVQSSGFKFRHETLPSALAAILGGSRHVESESESDSDSDSDAAAAGEVHEASRTAA